MSSGIEHISLCLEGLPFEEATLVHYRIDEEHGDPFKLWETPPTKERAATLWPSPQLYSAMREHQELELLAAPAEVVPANGSVNLEFDLPLHSVSLILLNVKPASAPQQVTGVACERYESLTQQSEVMVTWTGLDSRMIQTYEVLCSPEAEGPYQRVNPADLLCSAYLHVVDAASQNLFYKVRAVDYWGRAGMESSPVQIQF
jgi:hypothetical protein